jgi:hypothetical protein
VISPEEAVKAYHAVLEKLNIRPHRPLADDLVLLTGVMSYGGSSTVTVLANVPQSEVKKRQGDCGCGGPSHETCRCGNKSAPVPGPAASDQPNFATMTRAEKLAYNKVRRDRIFG